MRDAAMFIERQEPNVRRKILYNMTKAQYSNDPILFKKLNEEIWEFRTLYNRNYYRVFSFWIRSNPILPVVVSTHGIIKKSKKIEKKDLTKAQVSRLNYLEAKNI